MNNSSVNWTVLGELKPEDLGLLNPEAEAVMVEYDQFNYFLVFLSDECYKYNFAQGKFRSISRYKCPYNVSQCGMFYDRFGQKIYKANASGIAMCNVLKSKWFKCSKQPLFCHQSRKPVVWINDKLLYVASYKGIEYYGLDKTNVENFKIWKTLYDTKSFAKALYDKQCFYSKENNESLAVLI